MSIFPLIAALFFSFTTAQPTAQVTWSKDVAPILYQHCVECHRQGQPAPFPLLTYRDAKARGELLRAVTRTHYMPPWKPVEGYGTFAGTRRLSKAEIGIIDGWVREGMPEGDLSVAPGQPVFPSGWAMGKPDAVLRLPRPYQVAADGPDIYRCFVIPTSFGADRWARAYEFRPGVTGVLHHALIFVDGRRNSQLPDNYGCFGAPGFLPSAALGGWTPGTTARSMPEGTATHIPKGARIVVQLHFHPTGKAERVNPEIGLYFAANPPTRWVMDVPLGSNHIDIPAGDSAYKVHDHFTLPVALQVVGVIPHAHYLCKDMRAWAILPGGRKKWLLWIDDWDFNWQNQYRYAKPFTLPADTEVAMEFTYDNSAANVRNPNHPPKRVGWGPASTDEMAGLHLQVVPANDEDMHELGMALWGKVMRGVGGSFYRKPVEKPTDLRPNP